MDPSSSDGVDSTWDLEALAVGVLSSSTAQRLQALGRLTSRIEANGRSTLSASEQALTADRGLSR